MKQEFPPNFNILTNVPLSEYTRIKIGGRADYLAAVSDQDDLIELYRFCQQHGIRVIVLGHGSNIFFSDNGFRGLAIVAKFDQIKIHSENVLSAKAGASLAALSKLCIQKRLTGLEFSSGIPGTVGGAVYGNAGAYGKAVGDCLSRAKILTTEGKVKWVDSEFFRFSYRYSELKINNAVVLEAEFIFQKGDPKVIIDKVNEILTLRCQKLPPDDLPTAGSYFKNIKDARNNPTPAAKYLDAIGSKEICVGGAAVYHGHANIIFNKGGATARDVLKLEDILTKRVFEKFGVKLEREVVYIE